LQILHDDDEIFFFGGGEYRAFTGQMQMPNLPTNRIKALKDTDQF